MSVISFRVDYEPRKAFYVLPLLQRRLVTCRRFWTLRREHTDDRLSCSSRLSKLLIGGDVRREVAHALHELALLDFELVDPGLRFGTVVRLSCSGLPFLGCVEAFHEGRNFRVWRRKNVLWDFLNVDGHVLHTIYVHCV